MAHTNAYATDLNPSTAPRLAALINFADGTGANPSGIVPAVAADPSGFLANGDTMPSTAAYSLDNLISLGLRRVLFNRPFGDWSAAGTTNNCPGHYPHNFPTASVAGLAHAVTPRNQVQSETAFGNTTYTAALKAAFDTAGRMGTVYGCDCYLGPLSAAVATDTTTLDAYSEFLRYMDMGAVIDVQAALSHTNSAPPAMMGANCLGWWEGSRLAYTNDAGSTLATADGDHVANWQSLFGTRKWLQISDDARPIYKIGANGCNGYPVVLPVMTAGAATRYMTLNTGTMGGSNFTIIVVIKPTATLNQGLLGQQGVPTQLLYFNEVGAGQMSILAGAPYVRGVTTAFATDAWHVLRFHCDGANCKLYKDGVEYATYATGTGFTGTPALDQLFRYNNGAAFGCESPIAALAIMDANCTANQAALIEAYWGSKYAISVTGSPVLPQKAFADRMFATYTRKLYREDFNFRTITELSEWDTNSSGILTVYGSLAAALADPTNIYTKASIGTGQRARVMILNDGTSVATRISRMYTALSLGYDVDLDFGGFSTQDITYAVNQHKTLIAQPGIPSTGGQALPEPLLRLG